MPYDPFMAVQHKELPSFTTSTMYQYDHITIIYKVNSYEWFDIENRTDRIHIQNIDMKMIRINTLPQW